MGFTGFAKILVFNGPDGIMLDGGKENTGLPNRGGTTTGLNPLLAKPPLKDLPCGNMIGIGLPKDPPVWEVEPKLEMLFFPLPPLKITGDPRTEGMNGICPGELDLGLGLKMLIPATGGPGLARLDAVEPEVLGGLKMLLDGAMTPGVLGAKLAVVDAGFGLEGILKMPPPDGLLEVFAEVVATVGAAGELGDFVGILKILLGATGVAFVASFVARPSLAASFRALSSSGFTRG